MTRFHLLPILLLVIAAAPAAAQEDAAAAPHLNLELNALDQAEGGCRISFVANNALGAQLDRAGLELALFNTDGGIDRLVTLDFKALAPGRTKVLQFEIAGLACDDLGRVLINDITACEGVGLAPEACLDGLVTTARPDIVFGS